MTSLFFFVTLSFSQESKQQEKVSIVMSAQHAFVVQFTSDADPASGQCSGRVEHVVSGQATHFQSEEELWAFCSRVLADVRASSSDDS